MAETRDSRFPQFADDTRRIWSNVTEMVALRRRLAASELQSDVSSAKRLLLFGGIGVVALLLGASLLTVVLVASLEVATSQGTKDYMFQWRSWIVCSGLLIGGFALLWSGWRRFRQDFSGLQESIAEVREDLAWLREWIGGQDSESTADARGQVA